MSRIVDTNILRPGEECKQLPKSISTVTKRTKRPKYPFRGRNTDRHYFFNNIVLSFRLNSNSLRFAGHYFDTPARTYENKNVYFCRVET